MFVELGAARSQPRPLWRFLAPLCLLAAVLAGCADSNAAEPPTPTPLPPPTPSPTVQVGFEVAVTAVPQRKHHKHRARPRPTPFVPPVGPYIRLWPQSGPPVERRIIVGGAHFPPGQQVRLVWAPGGQTSPVSTTTQSGPKGGLKTSFSVPASPPGSYHIVAEIEGVPYASTLYDVTSRAELGITVSAGQKGEQVAVRGKHFLPDLRLALVAYSSEPKTKPVLIGTARTDRRGRLRFTGVSRALVPGQYTLRAFSVSALSAQMAETFFQVIV